MGRTSGDRPADVPSSEPADSAETPFRTRITVRSQTRWFTPPPETGAPRSQPTTMPAPVSTGSRRQPRVSIREDHVGDAVRSRDDGHALLLRTVPRLLLAQPELAGAPIDHHEGFVIAHVDGKTSVQALIDISGMPDDDLLALLHRLRRLGIITLG